MLKTRISAGLSPLRLSFLQHHQVRFLSDTPMQRRLLREVGASLGAQPGGGESGGVLEGGAWRRGAHRWPRWPPTPRDMVRIFSGVGCERREGPRLAHHGTSLLDGPMVQAAFSCIARCLSSFFLQSS